MPDDTQGMKRLWIGFVVVATLLSGRISDAGGFTLRGTVTAGGTPVSGAAVTVRGAAVQLMRCRSSSPNCRNPPPKPPPIAAPIDATTKSDGGFEIPDLPNGEYLIIVVAPGMRKRETTLSLRAATTIAITMKPAH